MRLTLADLEQERGDVEPFELDLDGGVIVSLPHPEDLPFESLVNFDPTQPAAVLRVLMGDDAFDQLIAAKDADGKNRVTVGMLKVILDRYYKHYGLGTSGEGAASRPSSIGSARQSKSTSRRRASA